MEFGLNTRDLRRHVKAAQQTNEFSYTWATVRPFNEDDSDRRGNDNVGDVPTTTTMFVPAENEATKTPLRLARTAVEVALWRRPVSSFARSCCCCCCCCY